LESVEKKIQRTEKQARIDPKLKAELDILLRCKAQLEKGRSIRELALSKEEKPAIADLFLLTDKPVLYVANVDEASMHTGNAFSQALQAAIQSENAELIIMNNSIEAQIAEMDTAEDKALFMSEYGMQQPALDRLIHATYTLLNLFTYFTAGKQEVRAWTIHQGWKAPQAAGVIHTDFEKGFIKAEVISYEDFVHYGSEAACREVGKLRIEGKEYIVKDGDVMHFRFNV
jgi:GTP-binding protein YchF